MISMQRKDQSVIGIIFSENRTKVLLVKRRDVPVWVLPGGGIDNNETKEIAIQREILEETGFENQVIKKVGEYTPINKLSKYTHLYECKILSGEAKITNETRDVKFFDLNNLPKLIPPPHPEWIEESYRNEEKLIKRELKSVNYLALLKNFFLHPVLVIRFLLTKVGLTINS